MAKKSKRKPKWQPPRFAIITDHFPSALVGQHDIQTGRPIPESKKAYRKRVEQMGFVQE